MSTLKVNTVLSADTPTVNITDGLNVTGVSTVANITATTLTSTNIVNATSLSHRNLIINGAMQVAQRGDTASVTSGYGGADRFKFDRDGATAVTLKQGGSGVSPVSEGFSNCQHIDITTADTSMGSANYNILTTRLEGYNLQGIQKGTANARELTLSFYIKSTVTGTYIVELVDQSNSSRHVNKAYTVSASNTWEKKEITFPADTTGTITSDQNRRLDINWWLGAGSTYNSGTLQTSWGADTNANRAVGQVNAVNSTSNDIMITGVQLEVGSVATPFEHRNYGEELEQCSRYYYRINGSNLTYFGVGNIDGGNEAQILVKFATSMREPPSSLETSGTANHYTIRVRGNATGTSVPTLSNRNERNAMVIFTAASHGFTDGQSCFGRSASNDAFLAFVSEL